MRLSRELHSFQVAVSGIFFRGQMFLLSIEFIFSFRVFILIAFPFADTILERSVT